VHVRDVAVGHILAAEKGLAGERYSFGQTPKETLSMKEAFDVLQEITGIPAPNFQIPTVWPGSSPAWTKRSRHSPANRPARPMAGVQMAAHKMFFNPAKAIRELGPAANAAKAGASDAVDWFRANGYAPASAR